MNVLLRKLWKSIRRNPVINAFLLAVAGQMLRDFLANQIDWTNLVGYLSMVLIGVAAREFTVPASENEAVKQTVSDTIVRLEANHQECLNELANRFGGDK